MTSNRMMFKDFKVKSVDASQGYVEGYASRYNVVDTANDVIVPGAFKHALSAPPNKIRFLWGHDKNQPIGSIVEIRDTPDGLWFKAKFASSVKAQDTRDLMMMEPPGLDSFSIGYRVVQESRGTWNGRAVNLLKEIKVHEISVVPFPANEDARMTAIKSELGEQFKSLPLDEQELVSSFIEFLEQRREKAAAEESFRDKVEAKQKSHDETEHLLSTEANADALLASTAVFDAGDSFERDLIQSDDEVKSEQKEPVVDAQEAVEEDSLDLSAVADALSLLGIAAMLKSAI